MEQHPWLGLSWPLTIRHYLGVASHLLSLRCIYIYISGTCVSFFFANRPLQTKVGTVSRFRLSPSLLLVEEILHHLGVLGCIKPCKIIGYLPYQLAQDFWTINRINSIWNRMAFFLSNGMSKKVPSPKRRDGSWSTIFQWWSIVIWNVSFQEMVKQCKLARGHKWDVGHWQTDFGQKHSRCVSYFFGGHWSFCLSKTL